MREGIGVIALKEIVQTSLRIDRDLLRKIDAISQEENMSRNELMVQALHFYEQYVHGYADFDNLFIQRMDQLVDTGIGLAVRLDAVSENVRHLTEMILRYQIGDGYFDLESYAEQEGDE